MVSIVIVDDSREDSFLAERVIRQAKILNPVLLLNSAAECIAYFQNREQDEPALVFVDLAMFPTSGLEVLHRLRGNPAFRESVVVMLTAVGDFRGIGEGYQAGATTFLVKPLHLDELLRFLAAFSRNFVFRERAGGYHLHWAEPRQTNRLAGGKLQRVNPLTKGGK